MSLLAKLGLFIGAWLGLGVPVAFIGLVMAGACHTPPGNARIVALLWSAWLFGLVAGPVLVMACHRPKD